MARTPSHSSLLIPLVITLLFLGNACGSLSETGQGSGDTLIKSREECLNVPNCTSIIASVLTTIEGTGRHSLHFSCPDEAPHLHNIDVDQDRNVAVAVMDYLADAVHVLLRKLDPEKLGRYQVFLGCSTEPFTQGERFDGRYFGPEDLADLPSIAPDPGDAPPDACDSDIPDCVNVVSAHHKIGHLKTEKSDLVCPESHPWYALAWVHSRISGWVSITEDPFSKTRFEGRGDAFLVTNWSVTHDHHWQIAIACSSNCNFANGGCPDNHCKSGCRNDPGCRTIIPRKTQCAGGNDEDCWTTWDESCPNGEEWFCNTSLGWTCCESC